MKKLKKIPDFSSEILTNFMSKLWKMQFYTNATTPFQQVVSQMKTYKMLFAYIDIKKKEKKKYLGWVSEHQTFDKTNALTL